MSILVCEKVYPHNPVAMTVNSKYFDSIRISSKSKAKEKPDVPQCQWDDCDKPGSHKAPVGRMREGEYLHFCINHVREYNKSFNYFSGLADGDIARFQKDALTGHRPTWTTTTNTTARSSSPEFSRMRSGSAAYFNRMRDPNAQQRSGTARAEKTIRRPRPLEAKALATMGLTANSTSDAIKSRYKELVKLHHPDANGGDRASEERFRDVIQAYKLLKQAGLC